jgi:hypothetical protein
MQGQIQRDSLSSALRNRCGRRPALERPGASWSNPMKKPLGLPAQRLFLVEARGVEPLSEDRQRTASTCVADSSTCVADSLAFAAAHARRQA